MTDAPLPDGQLDEAVAVLRRGGLVAFPTETVYGLGADARNPAAIARIFAAKHRPADHPVIVHLGEVGWLDRWARDIPEAARVLADAFWPGPLAMVLHRADGVPDEVTGGIDTVGLRMPGHPVALALLRAFGDGIAAPSANRYGRVSPTTAAHVHEELGDRVDLVLDGGRCEVGIESTIVDLSTGEPRLLRPGAITAEAMERVLGMPVREAGRDAAPAPGRKPSHYAPRARVVLADADGARTAHEWRANGARVGLLSAQRPDALDAGIEWLAMPADVRLQARDLYQRLRDADRLGLDVVVAVLPEDTGVGHALRDRLRRAAGLGDGRPDPAVPFS
jgi:L-threonylcarbamoyladenylate synthase